MNTTEILELLDKGYVVSGTADLIRQQQAEIEALTTQFVRVADENNRLKDQIIMLTKGKVEYGYDTTKTS